MSVVCIACHMVSLHDQDYCQRGSGALKEGQGEKLEFYCSCSRNVETAVQFFYIFYILLTVHHVMILGK
jgi:hypothetical protein